ncbi:MAG: GDSL-type esterase/lipase family protein, partial [Actinomycetota bacterium]|nr:GDSL-type esterase/lipase family protein [Actinomycetota bacterium]
MTLTEPPVPQRDHRRTTRPPISRLLRSRWSAAFLALAVVAGYLALSAARGTDKTEAAIGNTIDIMLVGDSITSGRNGFPLEAPTYRGPFNDKLTLGGYNYDLVGSQSGLDNLGATINPPITGLSDPDHEGHNGWRLDEMVNGNAAQPGEGKLADWVTSANPDIVVIYGGANDFAQGEEASQVYSEFIEAIAAMRSAKSDVRIVITNNHPHENSAARNAKIDTLNPFIPMLEELSTPTSPIITVDIHTGYPSSVDDNGSHPGPDGQEFFAEQIFRALENSGFMLDATPQPTVNNTTQSAKRGERGAKIALTGRHIYANFTADFGDGVTVVNAKWNNNKPNSSSVTLTVDVDLWADTGKRDIVLTNPDGDSVTCSNCLDVKSAQVAPPLKIMILGGETTSGRRYVPAEEPTYRGDLWDLINSDGIEFDFVGSQQGVDSGDLQTLPLVTMDDIDHEGHSLFHVNELISGKAGEEAQGDIDDWMTASDPDVVVIFAGQQDVRAGAGQSDLGVVNELVQLVDKIRGHNPNVRIVVTNINRHKTSTSINTRIDDYNAFFAANKDAKFLATDEEIATADVSGAALNSGTYPNAAGNLTIATAIYNALSSNGMLDPVAQPPGPPSSPSVTGTLGSVTVDWSAPPTSGFELTPVTGYTVVLSPGGATQNVGAGTTSAAFTSLTSSTTYTASITAQNAAGEGPAAQASGSPTASYETDGYWMVQATGAVHAFGGAADLSDPEGQMGGATAVALAGHPTGGGYWVLASDGTVYAYGTAATHAANNSATLAAGESVTSVAAHPDGNGYWV